jgi:anthranilate phosphoribosyltransferase
MQVRSPADYGLPACTAADLAGGDARHNAQAIRAVLYGEDRGAHRDCLLLGTALALEVAGAVQDPRAGIECAAAAIASGAARRVVDALDPAQRAGAMPVGPLAGSA